MPVAVADILQAASKLRCSHNADDLDSVLSDATADLLEHIADTWDQQDDQTRLRTMSLALALIL
ncbi:hypothetical protein [Streptomyces sp. NBC_00989]|uniref:hypothetical protein n=1 Tax=Streptomyces sp. NBC_00989 TaxID=2903705 RepID=UPI00386F8B82|nr:hypothetical protein OG714_54265 [Streptomyces sp. NBC_00989]